MDGRFGVSSAERAPEPQLVALDLDVPDVADLLDGRERLAGHAFPG